MAEITRPPAQPHDEQWFRHNVLTRAAATVWWVVMVVVSVWVVVTWTGLAVGVALHDDWTSLAVAVLSAVISVPIWREWPSASRMWRMLRHGT